MLLNSLGRVLVASGIVAVTSFMASTAAFADTTASVAIQGIVDPTLAIASSNPKQDINLSPLVSPANAREVKVADLKFGTNNSTGLTVTVDAANSLTLAKPDGITPVAFQVQILAGSPEAPTTLYQGTGSAFVTNAPAAITTDHSLYIQYAPAAFQDPGTYRSTIGLTVADN